MATPVQIGKLNSTVRPGFETLIRVIHELRALSADLTAFQAGPDNFPIDANPIVDGRDDVPVVVGNIVQSLITNVDAMLAEITPAEEEILIQVMVRPLPVVVRLG